MISFILNKKYKSYRTMLLMKNYLLRGGRAMGKMRIEGGHGSS